MRQAEDEFEIELTETEKKTTGTMTSKDVFYWVESLILPLVTVVIIMMYGARVNEVFGISMEPTLFEGDKILVFSLLPPEHGDIVIIDALNLPNAETGEMGEPIVKRVVGLPGDVIYIDAETGDIFRNNELLEEKYIKEKITAEHLGNQKYPLTIKENEIFVLGDNRNHSTDSRIAYEDGAEYYVGCVDKRYVVGVVSFRIYPFDRFGRFNV